ncbi:MAG: hypothetical protein M3Q89_06390 [Verrucomicrobiota bacterium]|nr:hypothetical protein [Verrucomicrobiota bacterium]
MRAIYRSKLLWALIILVIAALVARAMLPIWVRDYVNRKLNEMEDYTGHVVEVDIHLWRGAYSAHGVEIKKRTGSVPVPFFSAPVVDLSVEWKALFQGALVGEIHSNSRS